MPTKEQQDAIDDLNAKKAAKKLERENRSNSVVSYPPKSFVADAPFPCDPSKAREGK